jgi:hypothetical protein
LIGEVASPYSGAAQQQDWMTDFWQGMMTLPQMSADQASQWRGFLAEMRGKLNVFRDTPPPFPGGCRSPARTAAGSIPTVPAL